MKKNREAGRDVYVEDDLFTKVFRHADQPTRDAMDLAYLTGQRPQDTLRLDERGQRMTLDTLQRRFRETRREASVPDGAFQIRDLRAKAGTDKTDTTGDTSSGAEATRTHIRRHD